MTTPADLIERADPFRPVTMQDVRLAVGEGPLKPADVLAGCNAELRRRSSLAARPALSREEVLKIMFTALIQSGGTDGLPFSERIYLRAEIANKAADAILAGFGGQT